jgi:hypothetical protein
LVSLFSKKRKHFLTIGFKDEGGKEQVAVIELGKDIVRTTLAIVQTRSGRSIEYQDEEARKSAPAASVAPLSPAAPALSAAPPTATATTPPATPKPSAPEPPPPSPVEAAKASPAGAADPTAARAALEAGARAENARDWPTALRHYERAKTLDPSMAAFIDVTIARVREQTSAAGGEPDALRRARQYDALGRRTEAITWYERALEALPESDPNREVIKKRLSELKGA